MGTLFGISPRMRFDIVLNTITAFAINEKEFKIFGGEQWRPMVHVDDAAEAYIAAIEAPIEKVKGEVFNVGSDEGNHKIIEMGKKVNELIPEATMIVSEDEVDMRDYNVSFKKIREKLGFTTKKTISDGILEIKKLFEDNQITNFRDTKYNNYQFLKNTP